MDDLRLGRERQPLFWDDEVAHEITDGPMRAAVDALGVVSPASLGSGRTEQLQPLQVHFDLKEALGLPEAVISDNTITFGDPVRIGDLITSAQILRSVSDEKTTKLGTGRFWVIDVEYRNQDGAWVGTESYTGFGYRREES